MTASLESLLHEALSFEGGASDDDQTVLSAELAEWFTEWRQRARAVVRSHRSMPTAAIYAQQFQRQLVSALRALQLMHERAEPEGPFSQLTGREQNPREIDELIQALNHGGIHIICGEFRAMVFKQPAKESPCKRR